MRDNPGGGQVDLGSANNFETVLGYHLGLGGKPRCPATLLEFRKMPDGFQPDTWLKSHHSKKATKTRARNQALLEVNLKEAVDQGLVSLLTLPTLAKAVEAYEELKVS